MNKNQILYHIQNRNVHLDQYFLVNLTAPNKQSFRVRPMFTSCDYSSISYTINKFTTLFGVKATLPCLKQLCLN